MTDEIPPSSLTVSETRGLRPAPDKTSSGELRPADGDFFRILRVTTARWHELGVPRPTRAALVAIGAWVILAWNRFGFQGVSAPRAVTRFVLVGVYGWIGLMAVVWLAELVLARRSGSQSGSSDWRPLLLIIGLAHQPILVFGFLLQIGQAFPVPYLLALISAAVFLLWLPAVLMAAVESITESGRRTTMVIVGLAYGAWLLTVGRFLLGQLGHLA